MAVACVLMAVESSSLCFFSSACSLRRETNGVQMDPSRIVISSGRNSCLSMRMRTSSSPPSSNPQPEEDDTTSNDSKLFASPEDLNYLLKLGAGSVGGAAVIKYGSIIFPEITKPNILEALIIISLPVIVAALLLTIQSHIEKQKEEPS